MEVFKNAYILKTTHVGTFRGQPSELTSKGYVFERYVKFAYEG